jgi:hypothetical protein
MVVTQAGQIVTFHPDGGALLTLDRQGNPIGTVPVDVPEAHGIALVAEGDRELLWLADAAAQKDPAAGYEPKEGPPVVAKIDLQGGRVATLEQPDHRLYADGPYKPTCVTVDEPRFGGGGDVWVAERLRGEPRPPVLGGRRLPRLTDGRGGCGVSPCQGS